MRKFLVIAISIILVIATLAMLLGATPLKKCDSETAHLSSGSLGASMANEKSYRATFYRNEHLEELFNIEDGSFLLDDIVGNPYAIKEGENKYTVFILIDRGTGSAKYEIKGVELKNDGELVVSVRRILGPVQTKDYLHHILKLELDKNEFPTIKAVSVLLENYRHY